jgi:hypothetical protein
MPFSHRRALLLPLLLATSFLACAAPAAVGEPAHVARACEWTMTCATSLAQSRPMDVRGMGTVDTRFHETRRMCQLHGDKGAC